MIKVCANGRLSRESPNSPLMELLERLPVLTDPVLSEFEKYRFIQDRLFESDFDRVIKQLKQDEDHET